jgi:phosphonate transport system substrate-binding protein
MQGQLLPRDSLPAARISGSHQRRAPVSATPLLLLLLLWLLPADDTWPERVGESSPQEAHPLTLGVYTHIRSTEMLPKMAPLQAYLREALERRGIALDIQLKIFPSYARAIDALVRGEVDFARYGPVSYVLAKERNPNIRLLAMESNQGRKTFNGVISVPLDSPIRSVEDLRGKRIAFGNRRSTTGRYLAQAALLEAGIDARNLGGYTYLGRHDKVAFAVAAGNYDAGATNENTFYKYAGTKGLRKILEFPCVTKPWVAREGLDPAVFDALQQALLELKDPEVLKTVNRDGLLPSDDADYNAIRKAMTLAGGFDPTSLAFGIYASVKPSQTFNMVRPLIRQLERDLAGNGSLSVLNIRVFPDYEQAIDTVSRGDVDFARLGPASCALTKEINPGIRILAREHSVGGPPAGVFVVPDDSALESLSGLAGKRLAFANRHSTEGRYLAQAALVEHGIHAEDLAGYRFLGRHDRVAHAVARGIYDAGALRESALKTYKGPKPLRVIHRFESAEKLWIARAGMPRPVFDELRQWLLGSVAGPALAPLGIDGFTPAKIDDPVCSRLSDQIHRSRSFEAHK